MEFSQLPITVHHPPFPAMNHALMLEYRDSGGNLSTGGIMSPRLTAHAVQNPVTTTLAILMLTTGFSAAQEWEIEGVDCLDTFELRTDRVMQLDAEGHPHVETVPVAVLK